MNKSLATNLLAGLLTVAGFVSPVGADLIKSIGLFALSGALTNWLAVHMLFERVPGLYGSGVIPLRFEEFKSGIRDLILEQFFRTETIDRLLAGENGSASRMNLDPVLAAIDYDRLFDGLTEVVKASSFGGMLAMVGGDAALLPLKEPFQIKARTLLAEVAETPEFQQAARDTIFGDTLTHGLRDRVETLVDARLQELTPQTVKEIVQDMIRQHLGWLVVWGGIFGGLVGLAAYFLP